MTTFAVIPAAGQSVRMGRPKLSLPLGDRTVLERVLDAVLAAGIDHAVVVIGPDAANLLPLVKPPAQVLQLNEPTPDMRATVERGLTWIEERFHPLSTDAWLLIPADHPTLDASVVRMLLCASKEAPGASIVVPTFDGRRGHPTLIAWKHAAEIRSVSAGLGLNAYLRSRTEETLEMPVAAADILTDLDTPADYERLRQRVQG
jgi:molybdenum cofactor cytidylyltransferase